MENNQYKGFAYTKGSDKPTVVFGTSAQDILTKLNSYNIARTENDKFMACNIGSLNAETSKYEEYHRYDVATGKDISSVYLQIPPLKKEEFQKVIADLKAAGARYNVQKKAWYISADQDQQGFQDICNQFSNNIVEIDAIRDPEEPEKPDFMIEGVEVQYAVKMQNQQTVIIPESDLNMLKLEGSMNEFLDRLNEKAVGQLQQISSDLEQIDPGQIASESEYMISVDRNSHFNRCTVWFNDGREPVSLNGYVYGLDFLSMETDAVAEFVSEYLRQQDHLENGPSPSGYREGDWINCYVPLRLQDSTPNQPIYVENIRYISGTVQAVQPSMERDGSSNGVQEYTILDDIGSVQTIRSDEIYTDDQARVLLRAAADELTGVQFDLLADRRLSAAQMEEIRFGYKDGLSVAQVALYANPEMKPAEMDLCRIGLANGLEYAELSSLLKETKELSWTDSRNRLNEVIKMVEMVEKARTTAHEAGLAFSENTSSEEIDPYVYDGSMSIEDHMQVISRIEKEATVNSVAEPSLTEDKEAAQTADFFGTEVPVENGMRVISSDEIFFGLYDRDNIDVLDFTNCIFHDVDFSQAFWDKNLSDADFSNSMFYDCKFDDVDLSRSSFQGASLYHTRFKNAVLKQCDFGKATISGGAFQASDVAEVNFSKAIMKQINIEDCAIEENDFYMAHMDSVKVSASCDITADQKNLDTVTYTISGADPAEIEKMKDKVMWRLSGSEITYERKEELSRLFKDERNNPDTWREDLTYEERELVESWEKQRSTLSDVLLEKQHRQERYNNMSSQSGEKRSVVNQLHEKQKLVSASAEAPAHEDRIRRAEAIAK